MNQISEKLPIDNYINSLIREKAKPLGISDSSPVNASALTTDITNSNISSNIEDSMDDEDLKLHEILSSSASMRKYFLEKACSQTKFSRDHPVPQDKWKGLKTLTGMIINNLTENEEKEYELFYYLVNFLIKFYKESDKLKKKRYLGAIFKNHPLFSDISRWENLTYYLVHRKKLEEYQKSSEMEKNQESKEKEGEEKKSESKGGLMNRFANVRKRIEGLLDSQKYVSIDEASLRLSVVDEINVYLLHLELDHQLTSKILLHITKKVGIDYESRNMLSSILEKKTNSEIYKQVNLKAFHHVKKIKKHGNVYPILLALDFLGYKDNLLSLLLVSKDWNRILEKKIYRIALSAPDEDLPLQKRLCVWKNLMKLNKPDMDYFKIKEKYNLLEQQVFAVEDIITLDVQRSFHNHPQINTMILYNLLRIYAHYNPKVSYCQGMNYIMGFLFCLYREEDITFRFFVKLVDKYMKSFFEDDLESLRAVFYQFDRLISIFLPDLAEHFKKEGVETSLFSASWFITLFSNVFQHSHNSYTLMRIWDALLIDGWKGFFKCCLYLLDLHKEKLLKMRFDQILGFITEMVKEEIFTNNAYHETLENCKQLGQLKLDNPKDKIIHEFRENVEKIHVTKELLRSLEEDYRRIESETKELKKKTKK